MSETGETYGSNASEQCRWSVQDQNLWPDDSVRRRTIHQGGQHPARILTDSFSASHVFVFAGRL